MEEITLLRIEESRLDFSVVVNLEKKLNDLIKKGTKAILIDLQNVVYVDSRSIGLFVGFNILCSNKKVLLGLFGLCDDIAYIFKVTSVDTVLKIYANEEEALNNIKELLNA